MKYELWLGLIMFRKYLLASSKASIFYSENESARGRGRGKGKGLAYCVVDCISDDLVA